MDRLEMELKEIDEFIRSVEELADETDETVIYGTHTHLEETKCLEEADVRDANGNVIATLCRIY